MANTVFGWPDAWPGSGAPRLLTAGAGSARGLVLARNAARPALVRKATLGDDAGHPVRLWDVAGEEALVPDSVYLLGYWQDAPMALDSPEARAEAVRLWMGGQGVGTVGVAEAGVAEGAPPFAAWLTDVGGPTGVVAHRHEDGNQLGPGAHVSFMASTPCLSWAPGVTENPVCWRTVGFPTVAAGCVVRLAFRGRFRGSSRYPSDGFGSLGYPPVSLRAEVCEVGVEAGGVWPGRVALTSLAAQDFPVAIHRYADFGGAWDTQETALDTEASGELVFAVPEGRVVLFRVRLADPVRAHADFFATMPFVEREGEYSVLAVRPDDVLVNGFEVALA